MKTLQIKNLSVKYNYGALAVANFNMIAEAGDIYVVLGDGDSGKTSLLKCISGLTAPIEGNIIYNGDDITRKKPKERNICLVYEDGCFFENRTVFYNLFYPLKIRNISKCDAEKLINDTVIRLGLGKDLLPVKVKKLSTVERFLLALCRAYQRKADIYLFDNPLKKLSENRMEYFTLLKDIMTEKAKEAIVVFATASGKECEEIGGKVTLLNYGITLQTGTVEQIKKDPHSVGVIRKLLNAEPISGKIIDADGETVVVFGESSQPIDRAKLISEIFIGKECLVYVADRLMLFDVRSERLIYSD